MKVNAWTRESKLQWIDLVVLSICPLVGVVAIWQSATGRVDWSMTFFLLFPAYFLGLLAIAWRHFVKKSLIPAIAGAIVTMAIIGSVAFTQWPLRVSYVALHASLNSIAERVRAGERFEGPIHAGAFTIERAELSEHHGPDPDIVCLWTRLDPSGYTGFVQCPRHYVPFNLWSSTLLDDEWQFITED